MKVAGLGQCSLDYIAAVDGFPAEDTKEEALSMTIQGGGPVATALVSLSRLGVRTFFMGSVSDDRAGEEIKRGLREEGVDTRGLKVKKGGFSQRAFIIVNRANGSRTILWQRPSAGGLSPRGLDPALIRNKDLLMLDGLMAGASLKAAKIARSSGVPVMLDAGSLREGILDIAALSDYIVASADFARELAGTPLAAIKKLSALRPAAITVTLGEKGSLTWHGDRILRLPAFRVRAVDTTGAGDVFHGGYAYGILKGWDMRKTVEFASAFAALKCLKPGGRAGIPALGRTLRFMKGGSARLNS